MSGFTLSLALFQGNGDGFVALKSRAWLRQVRLQLEHRNFHHVDLAFVFVHASAQLDVIPYVILQSLGIDDIPGFSALLGDKRDFVTVCFHRTLDIH